jgi:hypothetical protein
MTMSMVADPDRLDQPGVHPWELGSGGDRPLRHLEEVEHLPDREPVPAPADLEEDDRALILGPAGLGQEDVAIEDGEQGATNVHQPIDRLGDPRNTGGRQAGEDLPHDPCRGRANQRTDAKDDGVERRRVSHLY